MRLKPNTHPKFQFVFAKKIKNNQGNDQWVEVTVPGPSEPQIHSIEKLCAAVTASMKQNGVSVPPKLRLHVEHQICVRYGEGWKRYCFSGGIGDDIHLSVLKVTQKLGNLVAKAGLRKVGKAIKAIGKCQGCGGSKVYRDGQNNLGRAGLLNQLHHKDKK